jgi:hypothetical protein
MLSRQGQQPNAKALARGRHHGGRLSVMSNADVAGILKLPAEERLRLVELQRLNHFERLADRGGVINRIPSVIKAEYRGGYRIHVTFDDNSEKTIDFRRWLKGPVFEPLKNLRYFRRFFLDGWTIAWPNGADIAPETLYEYAEVSNERGAA